MKIDKKYPDKIHFNTIYSKINPSDEKFEKIFKTALRELEEIKTSSEISLKESLTLALEKTEKVLETLTQALEEDLTISKAQTLGDWLLFQALELEKISETLPEGPQKEFLRTSAFLIGIEAQKLRNRVTF